MKFCEICHLTIEPGESELGAFANKHVHEDCLVAEELRFADEAQEQQRGETFFRGTS